MGFNRTAATVAVLAGLAFTGSAMAETKHYRLAYD